MTSMPLALTRFMTPCTLLERKLSEPDFMISRWMPTTLGARDTMSAATKSLRVVLAVTIALTRVCGTSA